MKEAPIVRKQGRRRHRSPNLNPNPKLGAEVREKYLQPIVPFTMYAVNPLPLFFGVITVEDMKGYAAHCETGVPWYSTQARWLIHLAPATCRDPLRHNDHKPGHSLHRRSARQMAVPRELRAKLKAIEPKPLISLVDRYQLRAKYEAIARAYLTGQFKGFGLSRPSMAELVLS